MDDLPPIPPELVEALDKLVPHRCPDPAMPDRAIWLYAGKRALVDFLQEVLRRQTENPLS
jgi:hypothetical protein